VTLAQVLAAQGEFDEAESAYALALDTLQRRLGPDHRLTLVSLGSLALLRRERQDYEGAAVIFRDLVERHRRVHGPNDKLTGDVLQNLATVLGELGRSDQARGLHEQAADVYRASIGTGNYYFALPKLSLAALDLAQSRYLEAELHAREALDLLRRVLPAGHVVTAVAECRLARALEGLVKPDDARTLFDKSAATLVDSAGLPAYRSECLKAAAAFFESRGEPERADTLTRALGGV
jgi:tetratricopeptide (TPR) repeat protein